MIRAIIFDMGDTLMEEADETKGPIDTLEVTLLPDAISTVQLLSQSYVLGGITNTDVSREDEVWRALESLGLARFFEAVVSSVDADCQKPDPRIFEECLRRLGVEAREAVMVGDRLEIDIKGANALGMLTVWYRWNGKYRGEPVDESETPTATIQSLRELPDVIGKLDQ